MARIANLIFIALLVMALAPALVAARSDDLPNTAALSNAAPSEQDRAVPGTVWYQGFLADVDTGDPINDTVEIIAQIFDSAVDGTGLWGPETHGGTPVVEGWFNIELGSIESPLPDFSTPPYYVQLTINGETMDERQKLASAPTAIRAGDVDGGGGGGISGGGSAGYVPIFTAGTAIGNSNIFDTDGRYSIGTLSSDAKLRVENDGNLPPLKIVNTSSGNVPSMLHIERTEEIAFGDDMLYMTAPSADYGVSFIQCDLGTNKTVETKFLVSSGGDVTASSIAVVTDDGSPIYAKALTGNSTWRTIDAEYAGNQTYGAAVYGLSSPAADKGYGGDFTGGLCGVAGSVFGDGTASHAGLNGYAYATASGDCYGVFATANGGTTSYGVYGMAWGAAPVQWAGYFDGDVHSTGTITSAKSGFEIDHPSDPENAYLRHAYVASPEMKTVTDGTAVLDATGRATVALPEWFEALNSEVRYQLTPIGAAAPDLHIGSELSGGTFTIAGGAPGMKVCWLLTGIRKDRAAVADPLAVEAAKPLNARGKYVSPAVFGATKEMGIGHREIPRPTRDH